MSAECWPWPNGHCPFGHGPHPVNTLTIFLSVDRVLAMAKWTLSIRPRPALSHHFDNISKCEKSVGLSQMDMPHVPKRQGHKGDPLCFACLGLIFIVLEVLWTPNSSHIIIFQCSFGICRTWAPQTICWIRKGANVYPDKAQRLFGRFSILGFWKFKRL